MKEKELLRLKKQLEKSKLDKAQLDGELKNMMKTLKTDFQCDSVDEAEKLLKKMVRNQTKLEDQIAHSLEEIDEKYSKLFQDD